ncbi:hypothetical protein DOTSEDRAFT_73618 [Dothistroma septosporum NZE10]|uniref:4a-hydroxytetrahydrobiopterin dehydratase n=1 Tax=Dothistroma septosporum (strain NZE10 / CBS 128990) TaxID=675120 RepID=N1PIA5_DOTSN|nr:hypothetical protein DOTSEDRAFT_73618 [Dothistroma septosporum NZE10]
MSCIRAARLPSLHTSPQSLRPTRRGFSSFQATMVRAGVFGISQGETTADVIRDATALIDHGRWELCNNGKGLERGFKFKTFKATWDFMNQVASECKRTRHHPEWSNVYNKTHIRWTTHNPEGLSSKDTHMAKFCDDAAREFNELEAEANECKLGSDGKVEARDCCTPQKA